MASDKNEILYKEFGMNYNNELEIFKKGTVIVRETESKKSDVVILHVDIIKDEFWNERPWLLLDDKLR